MSPGAGSPDAIGPTPTRNASGINAFTPEQLARFHGETTAATFAIPLMVYT
jgi:hypothetical protein